MTKEQFKDDILLAMSNALDSEQLQMLKDVLVNKLMRVEFEKNTELATVENNNEYYLSMFQAFKGQRLSEKTMKVYMSVLNAFVGCVNKPLVNVTTNDIEFYLVQMSKKLTEVSLNNYKRYLSAFFSWMVKKRIITFNPCDSVEAYKEVKKPIDHLNPEDMEVLKNGCKDTRDRALIEFLRCTAVRVGEVVTVDINHIDFSSGKVIVYGHKTKTYRTVMLDKVALGYIKMYLNERGATIYDDAPLFISKRGGRRMSECGIRCILHNLSKNANIGRRIYPHLFRKSCATSIIRRGGTVGDASDYLGHSENTVTGKHYTFKDETHVENIFNKYVACV